MGPDSSAGAPLGPVLPASFGRYTLLERVGGGGMATVYRASLSGAGGFEKDVAVKVIRQELSEESQFTAMFLDEARLSARLNHANIVQTFDYGEHEGTHFLAMELVRGRTLAATLRICKAKGIPLGLAPSLHVAAEVAKALGYAHRLAGPDGMPLGIVHRDVSPQNVLVSREGEVKLADFGIAKAVNRSHVTQPGRVRGKCAYMAPEQIRGEELDGRADVFALGIVLWECLTCRPLFDGDSDAAVLMQVLEKELERPSKYVAEVPPEVDDLVLRLLARQRRDRPDSTQAARELADLTLRLIRSQAEIDLAELQRRLGSGTAVYRPKELLPPGKMAEPLTGRAAPMDGAPGQTTAPSGLLRAPGGQPTVPGVVPRAASDQPTALPPVASDQPTTPSGMPRQVAGRPRARDAAGTAAPSIEISIDSGSADHPQRWADPGSSTMDHRPSPEGVPSRRDVSGSVDGSGGGRRARIPGRMKRGLIGAGAAVALTAAGGAWFVGGDRSTTHDVPPADAAAPPSVLERGPGEPVAGAAAEVPTPPAASADADRDSSASPDAGEVAAAAGGPETEREGANPDAGKAVAAPAERAASTPTRPVRTERPAAVAPAKAPAQRAPAREVAHAQLVIATRMPNRTWVRIDGKEPVRLGPSPSSFDVPAGRRSVRVEREGSAACTLAVHLDPDAKRTLLAEVDGVSELVGTTRTPVACK